MIVFSFSVSFGAQQSVASFLTHPSPHHPPIFETLRRYFACLGSSGGTIPSREEKAEYLAHLLYRDAGLTLKDATVVPGGVLMSRRTEGDDAALDRDARVFRAGNGVPSLRVRSMTDAEVDSLFDDIAEDVGLGGMDAFVARVKSDG